MNKISKEELELEKKRRKYKFDKANVISQLDGNTTELDPEFVKIYKKYINCEVSLEECKKQVECFLLYSY